MVEVCGLLCSFRVLLRRLKRRVSIETRLGQAHDEERREPPKEEQEERSREVQSRIEAVTKVSDSSSSWVEGAVWVAAAALSALKREWSWS